VERAEGADLLGMAHRVRLTLEASPSKGTAGPGVNDARSSGAARRSSALKRAEARLEGGGPGDLRRRLGQARRDLELVTQLDAIRLKRVTRGALPFYKAQANQEYAEAFERAGLGTISDPPSDVATRIDAADVREALLAAVYDWAVCAADKARRGWLLEVARQTGSSLDGWRQRVLDPAAWEDLPTLAELARTAPVASESVSLLLALGERLMSVHGDAALFCSGYSRSILRTSGPT
jgi:hypothetical protein